jgi:hypothetical protein
MRLRDHEHQTALTPCGHHVTRDWRQQDSLTTQQAMVARLLRYWKHEHVLVDPQHWLRDREIHPYFKACDLLTVSEAQLVLRDIAYRDPAFLAELARDLRYSVGARADPRALLSQLARGLGRASLHDKGPPRFADFLIARRRRVRTHQPPLDPWKEVREAIEAAERAPRGFVIVETVNEAENPVAGVRCELLLANGEVRAVYTDSQGKASLDPIPQGQLHIRLPELDGSAWWPAQGASSTAVDRGRKSAHVVQRGECLAGIAYRQGIKDWKLLWNASENKTLRDERKLPNLLRPGDEVAIPARKVHEIIRSTDATHRLVISSLTPKARVRWSM